MSNSTPNLNLFKYDVSTDAHVAFSITEALNNNWDIIDERYACLNNPYSLFDSKYADHELNNLSWLKSEGQWNAKAVYTDAYDKLLKVYNGTETVEGLSVKLNTEEYNDYDFVLNTANTTFRLPLKIKQKFYDEVAQVVGNGMTLGLTNGSANGGLSVVSATDYAAKLYFNAYGTTVSNTGSTGYTATGHWGVTTDPTNSGIETHLTETTLYLYFYVGETVQNANLIDAGRIGEQLVNKQDKLIRYPIEISDKSLMPSWYVVYSDGWCEQGGYCNNVATTSFLKKFLDTDYSLTLGKILGSATDYSVLNITNFSESDFTVYRGWGSGSGTAAFNWSASGYLQEGEY